MIRIYEDEGDSFCRSNLEASSGFLISQCVDVDDCSGHGLCAGLNTCVCDPGFFGRTCDVDETNIVGCTGTIKPCGEDDTLEECDQAVIRLEHKERLAIISSSAHGNGVRLANLLASSEPTYRRAGDPESIPKKFHEQESGLFSITILNKENFVLFENGLPYSSLPHFGTGVTTDGADGLLPTVGDAAASPGVACVNKSWTSTDVKRLPLETDIVVVFACVAETLDCRIRYRVDFLPEPLPAYASAKLSRASLRYTPQIGDARTVTLQMVGNVDQFSSIVQHVSAPLALHTNEDPLPDPSGCYATRFSEESVSGKVVVLTAAGCHYWQAVLNAQRYNATAVILDFHDGGETPSPLSGNAEAAVKGCPTTQNDAAQSHYNPGAWDDADSSCGTAVHEGAIGADESVSHPERTEHCQPGTPCTGAQLFMYSACCYAFADPDALRDREQPQYTLKPDIVDTIIRKLSDGSSGDIDNVVKFWEQRCAVMAGFSKYAEGERLLHFKMGWRFGVGFDNVCSKIALDPSDPFHKSPASKGASIFGYVSTVVGSTADTPTHAFPSNYSNSHRFWTARRSVKVQNRKAQSAPGATMRPSYITIPALRVPACNDVDIIRGVYRGLIKDDQNNDLSDIVFGQVNMIMQQMDDNLVNASGGQSIQPPHAQESEIDMSFSGFRVPRRGANRYMCSIYSKVMWERKGRARSLREMYVQSRIIASLLFFSTWRKIWI